MHLDNLSYTISKVFYKGVLYSILGLNLVGLTVAVWKDESQNPMQSAHPRWAIFC